MSIGIAIAVPDGIALAADTQTTWNQTIIKAKDKNTGKDFDLAEPIIVPVGWSKMAKKLFSLNLAGKNYAFITAGMAHLNTKSMFAIFQSGAHKYKGDGSVDNVTQYFIDYLKTEISHHLSCSTTELKNKPINVSEFILTTYEENDVAKPVIESHLVFSGILKINGNQNDSGYLLKWSNKKQPNRYGGCWIGRSEFITHVVNHKNTNLPQISGQFGMMTLSDAIDYTRFLIEFTCNFQRFAIMVPDCGRPVASITLTPEGFEEKILK